MSVESHAVEIIVVSMPDGAIPPLGHALVHVVELRELVANAPGQMAQPFVHSSMPSRSTVVRNEGRQASGSTKSTLKVELRPVTAATAL